MAWVFGCLFVLSSDRRPWSICLPGSGSVGGQKQVHASFIFCSNKLRLQRWSPYEGCLRAEYFISPTNRERKSRNADICNVGCGFVICRFIHPHWKVCHANCLNTRVRISLLFGGTGDGEGPNTANARLGEIGDVSKICGVSLEKRLQQMRNDKHLPWLGSASKPIIFRLLFFFFFSLPFPIFLISHCKGKDVWSTL